MKLNIKKRDTFGKAVKNLRKKGQIPGVIYGKHVAEPMHVVFDKNEFLKVLKYAGESTPIDIAGDGIKELALIHGLEKNTVSDMLLHVDFLAVSADEEVKAEVPVILVGESPLEKNNEARVELLKDHILVEALPRNLPHDITIDKSNIKTLEDVVFVKDLNLGSKVTVKEDLELPVVTVIALTEEAEEETTAAEGTATESAEKAE